jgi:hypothetical protein
VIDPTVVVTLLLGVEVSGVATALGRCFGIALLGLGLACWPSRQGAPNGPPSIRGMLTYNVLIGLYLAGLGTVGHFRGVLLAGRWAACRRGVVAGVEMARRATDAGDQRAV